MANEDSRAEAAIDTTTCLACNGVLRWTGERWKHDGMQPRHIAKPAMPRTPDTYAQTIAKLTAERDAALYAEKERDEARATHAGCRDLRCDYERQLDEARARGDGYLADLKATRAQLAALREAAAPAAEYLGAVMHTIDCGMPNRSSCICDAEEAESLASALRDAMKAGTP